MRPISPISSRLALWRLALMSIVLTALFQASPAWAVEPFRLTDIRVEGLQRADAGTVFASLPFRIGDNYSDEKGAAALRALFATGLFKDVRIEIDGTVAVVIVEERSVISGIDFVGLKEFEKDALLKALKDFGISEGQPFDKALADRAEQELKRQYLSRSLYGVEIVTTVTPQERNRVNVTFNVTEGAMARIREIHIVGSSAFSESTLKGLFDLSESGWLSWYTKSDRYSRSKLNADLETLRAYYLNRGYLEFSIESTQVAISPDKQDISVTINVKEGQPYIVTGVKLDGEYLSKGDEFKSLVTIKPGEPYRAEDVAATTKAFVEKFGTFGYAFARVDARPEIDRVNGRVVLNLVGDPQRRVYVRRINVSGNSRSRDEVVRREFRQFESSWYDGRKIKLSRDRVDRLGYFSEVNIDTSEVPGSADQVDLTLTVKEKPTGNLMLGVGFSSADKLALTMSVKQDNIFGSGHYLGLDINTSKSQFTVALSTSDPYYTVDGISRSFDVYYRTTKPLNSQGEDYKLITPGGSVRFGVPFTEYDTVFFGVGYEQTTIEGRDNMPDSYFRYRKQFGPTSTSFPLTIGWTRDLRDSALVPTEGSFQRANVDLGVVGDQRYFKTDLQYQQYFTPIRRFTLAINAQAGYGRGLMGRDYPIFKNFFGGGLGSVRGFEQGSLGQVDNLGAFIGGNRRLNVNTELYVPLPGTGNDRTLRLFTYLDFGNVWAVQDKLTFDSLRASVGLGISWVSPVGPLKVSYGWPIKKQPTDRIQELQFQIGTAF
ncbi:MAG: outer membrane protein assembly factor BamA [Burkholderiales bacterium 28-67-8]|nr:MAG: outer membrane protein assembly factor BamA [Burkholderiales bacterium 28-67-8]